MLAPIGGVSEFSIAFSIISGTEGTIGVAESGSFNPFGNLGSDGENYLAAAPMKQLTGNLQRHNSGEFKRNRNELSAC